MARLTLIIFILSLLCGQAYAYDKDYANAVKARITPVGQIRLEQDKPDVVTTQITTQVPAVKPVAVLAQVRAAELIYKQHCQICHAAGIANAPRFHDIPGWAPRVTKGMDYMLKRAIKGFNAMPARGTCGNCSDAELKAAIEYMLPPRH